LAPDDGSILNTRSIKCSKCALKPMRKWLAISDWTTPTLRCRKGMPLFGEIKSWPQRGSKAFFRRGFPTIRRTVRDTLAALGKRHCRTREEFQAWAQNLGHSSMATTFALQAARARGRKLGIPIAAKTVAKAKSDRNFRSKSRTNFPATAPVKSGILARHRRRSPPANTGQTHAAIKTVVSVNHAFVFALARLLNSRRAGQLFRPVIDHERRRDRDKHLAFTRSLARQPAGPEWFRTQENPHSLWMGARLAPRIRTQPRHLSHPSRRTGRQWWCCR
jgi:hypothetical protein